MKTALAILLLSASVVMGAPALPQRGLVQEFDTIAEALASNPSQLTDTYVIKGLNAINDGLAGKFYFLAGDTSDTNSTDCFAWSTGRLKRTFDGVTASQVLVFGSSTNKAGDLTIETNGYMRLLYVVPTLGSGTVAVFDSNGTLTNGVASGFITAGDGITVSGSTVSTDLAEGSNITLTTNGSGTVTITAATGASGANPTATIGLSANNGSAPTFMRSDASPALGAVGTAGTYGDSSTFAAITTDVAGRVTAVTTHSVTAAQTNVALANPTSSVGLSAVNGSAATAMRSDGAPALDQGIAPTWTDVHKYSKNIGAILSVGDTTFVDLTRASQTNALSGALTFAHATNGLDGVDFTHVRWLFNGSGSDRTITIPSGWKTNISTAWTADRQITCTNATITALYVKAGGPTSSSTLQTNVYFSAEHYK